MDAAVLGDRLLEVTQKPFLHRGLSLQRWHWESSKVLAGWAFCEMLSQYPRSAFQGFCGVARGGQRPKPSASICSASDRNSRVRTPERGPPPDLKTKVDVKGFPKMVRHKQKQTNHQRTAKVASGNKRHQKTSNIVKTSNYQDPSQHWLNRFLDNFRARQ